MATNAKAEVSAKTSEKKPMDKVTKIKWIVAVAILVIFAIIPLGEVYTQDVKYFFMITVTAIYLMAAELVPTFVAAMALPIGYWISGAASMSTVFASWSSATPWILLGAFLLTNIMTKTGLDKRIAYRLMILGQGKFYLVMFLMVLAGMIVTCFVPAGTARMIVFASIGVSLINAMGWKPGSREATTAFAMVVIAAAGSSYTVMTGTTSNMVIVELLEGAGYPITWLEWAWYNLAPGFISVVLTFFGCIFVFRNMEGDTAEKKSSTEIKAFIEGEYAKLGKPKADEIKAAVAFGVIMLLLITSNYHSLSAGKVMMMIPLLCFLPGIDLLNMQDIKKTNFHTVFVVASCVTIGTVASNLGLGDLLVEAILPHLPSSLIGLSIVAFLICFFGNMLMTPLAIGSAVGLPIIAIAEAAGFSVPGFMMLFWTSSAAIIFPYESSIHMMAYGYGMMSMKSYIKFGLMRSVILLLSRFLLYIPWFYIIGLL